MYKYIVVFVILFAGCAKSPKHISPQYNNASQFEKHSCAELFTKQSQVSQELKALYRKLQNETNNDRVNVAAACFGLLPALCFLSGGHNDADVALYSTLLGEHELLQREIVYRQCE